MPTLTKQQANFINITIQEWAKLLKKNVALLRSLAYSWIPKKRHESPNISNIFAIMAAMEKRGYCHHKNDGTKKHPVSNTSLHNDYQRLWDDL